jgi:hypothetical protein
MESLKSFEWYRDLAGYRLAALPVPGKKALWIETSDLGWSTEQKVDRSVKLDISTTQYQGEKRIPKKGIYIAGHRQTINHRKPIEPPRLEAVYPFATNELVSLNLLRTNRGPKGWLDFTNRFGMIGREPSLHQWHMSGKDERWFVCDVEHEGEWHHLTSVLSKIYQDYPAIKKRDTKYLSKIVEWESEDVVRQNRGQTIGRTEIRPAIAMRGKHSFNAHYFEHMKRPDVFVPAAFALKEAINNYMEKSLSLRTSFSPGTLDFTSSLSYGSLGAALVAEAVEFMAGHFEARQCAVCGSWFRMGPGQMRRDRLFCSAACKMRSYRSRRSSKLTARSKVPA